ncbi:MAG: esterase-like activity of phytase family protein [Planctomycetales bacterium]|nr:esterase-like activity of phytase family protein [Planctomycetales bacterium]
MLNRHVWLVALLLLAPLPVDAAEPRYLGQAEIAGTATDLSRQAGQLEDGSPANRLGSYGSGIAWLGKGTRYAMIPDRGPADGATSYRCRFHLFDIAVDEQSTPVVKVTLAETVLLTHRSGQPLIGSSAAFAAAKSALGLRFDPEAIRTDGRGSFFMSDEYGPSIYEFDVRGKQIGELAIPSRFTISKPAANPDEELPPANTSGRHPNKGMECLAISADGETLFGLMQGPLFQDGALDANNKRVGKNLRLLEVQRRTGTTREFVYQLEHADHGCSEIEAIAPGRFLVIERDGKPGTPGSIKHIYEIDLREATDISRVDSLPATGLPAGIRAVTKRLFLDLLDPKWGLVGEPFPAKIEGITFGPRLKDGSRLLLISSDNDFKPDESSYVFAFAVSAK